MRANRITKFLAVLTTLAAGLWACDIYLPNKGGEHQKCFDNGKCLGSLVCVSNTCVSLDGGTDGGPACTSQADCDDQNPCTDDVCDPEIGCVHTANTNSCDDGNACTQGEHCVQGVCGDGTPVDCDDGNPCTDDSCNTTAGCTHDNNTAPCDDGKFCTAFDTCSGGACVGTGDPCPGRKCDETRQRCVDCTADTDCDDGRSCTTDSCDTDQGTCVHTSEITKCSDDGIYCNGTESCNPAAPGADATTGCAHSGDPCASSGKVCTEGTHVCTGCTSAADCDDHLSCTDDNCNVNTQTCTHVPNNSKCSDDGNYCNGAESCDPTASGSDSTTGCVHSGNPCAGGAVCTRTCNKAGKNCYDSSSTVCDDGVFCNGADTCDGAGNCLHTGDPCARGAACNKTCNEQNRNCYDAGGTDCDDGQFCNGKDTCDGSGHCDHAGNPCANGAECNKTCNESSQNCFDAPMTRCFPSGGSGICCSGICEQVGAFFTPCCQNSDCYGQCNGTAATDCTSYQVADCPSECGCVVGPQGLCNEPHSERNCSFTDLNFCTICGCDASSGTCQGSAPTILCSFHDNDKFNCESCGCDWIPMGTCIGPPSYCWNIHLLFGGDCTKCNGCGNKICANESHTCQ